MDESEQLLTIIREREITRLVHFTPSINLISIFEQKALWSREKLQAWSEAHPDVALPDYTLTNDAMRLDGRLSHINTSLQDINHFLFDRFKPRSESWCIVSINPEIICRPGTLFSTGNAASRRSKSRGIGGSADQFEALFMEKMVTGNVFNPFEINRENLQKNQPTDVQAEVLIQNEIPLDMITYFCFESEEEMRQWKGALLSQALLPPEEEDKFVVDSSVFKRR